MERNIVSVGIGNFVTTAMKIFGIEVNTKRQLFSIYDGLKPAYRRILYEEIKSGPSMRKTADIVGSCMSTTHGHGDASMKEVVSNLVRWGISKGQGNHGKKMIIGDDTEPSSMRYTEAAISEKFYRIFSEYMPYVDYVPADVKGEEPVYLPTVVPLCLLFGGMGIGLGVNCRIPAFTITSLMNAYLNDDPLLLEAPFGLHINYEKSELESLWTTGVGKICYQFDVKDGLVEDSYGFWLSGQPELFKPNLSAIEKLKNQGKVFIIDQTDKNSTKLFIGREYNIKSVTHEQVEELVYAASQNIRTYRLTVAKGDKVFLIPLKEWLAFTIANYTEVIERYKADKIAKSEFEVTVLTYLPAVVECLYNHRDWDAKKISENLKIDIDIVRSVLQKSINTLRSSDQSEKLEKLNHQIDEYKSIEPGKVIMNVINEF